MRTLGLFMALLVVACGVPELKLPKALEVVYLPEDGLIDVELAVQPCIYFSAAVDPASITAESVRLESASLEADHCAADWTAVEITAAVNDLKPQVVDVVPNAKLLPLACYQITLSTAIRGVELAALRDLGVPERPDVGALCRFRTRAE